MLWTFPINKKYEHCHLLQKFIDKSIATGIYNLSINFVVLMIKNNKFILVFFWKRRISYLLVYKRRMCQKIQPLLPFTRMFPKYEQVIASAVVFCFGVTVEINVFVKSLSQQFHNNAKLEKTWHQQQGRNLWCSFFEVTKIKVSVSWNEITILSDFCYFMRL